MRPKAKKAYVPARAITSSTGLFIDKQNATIDVNMHQIIKVVKNGELDENQLLQAHRLARLVFEPEVPEDSYDLVPPKHNPMQLDTWREKLSIPHANVLSITNAASSPQQATDDSEAGPSGIVSKVPDQMLATTLNYPRHLDGLESYHIFMAAVHPSARGMGLFSRLRDAAKEDARLAGYKTLTISTLPDIFKTMFALLSREGSGWEVVKWDEALGSRRVVMKMKLD